MATFPPIMCSVARIRKRDCACISIQYATWSNLCMVLIAKKVRNCQFLPFISKIRPASPIKLFVILICSIWTSTYIKMKKAYRADFSLECPMYRVWPHPPIELHWKLATKFNKNACLLLTVAENLVPQGYIFSSES